MWYRNRYDSTTGVFSVPSGGDGTYYFSISLSVSYGQFGRFDIQLNDETLCSSYGDNDVNGGGDSGQATCSAIAELVEGSSECI